MNKRVILMVLDSMGVGELPDANSYGDKGADTLGHIVSELGNSFQAPNLQEMGLFNIEGVSFSDRSIEHPKGAYGKMMEISAGKDTITGHWEMAGVKTSTPFKTYPDGFPKEFIEKFEEQIHTKVLGNYPASGTHIIEELGPEHEATGCPIVYTSSDSVFQIAANTDVIPLERLYEMCEIARKLLQGEWACGRVIARPYHIVDGKRVRTSMRHDYAVSPPHKTLLDHVVDAGLKMYAIGKIGDIFNGQGVSVHEHTKSNMDGVDKTIAAIKEDFSGFIFTNLVDFDSLFGHRRDLKGYGDAIMEFDGRLKEIEAALSDDDILILCADHGNDPSHTGYDHTREYIPVLVYGKNVKAGAKIPTGKTFADIGATICDYLEIEPLNLGNSFLENIINR